jgi:hypothetical protein
MVGADICSPSDKIYDYEVWGIVPQEQKEVMEPGIRGISADLPEVKATPGKHFPQD